jgi:predicted alpha/beta-fold hydrolase
LVIHGLTGCEDSFYVRRSAVELLRRGHPVARVNLRGAGPSRRKSRFQYHAGRSEDLHHLLVGLLDEVPDLARADVVLIGYSLGGNLAIKYLAEDWPQPARLVAGVSVSAPIDLKATQQRIMQPRNRVYHAYLLSRMKAESSAPPADLTAEERVALREAQSVYEFDDRFVAPRNGFRDAEDYYGRCSGASKLNDVRTPLLVIAAEDDPWIPITSYRDIDWSANAHLTPLIAKGGGHVGFHARDSRVPWHDRCITRYLKHLGI